MPIELGSATARILLDASGVYLGAQQARGALAGLQGNLTSVGKTMTTHVTLPLIGVGVAAAKVAGDFESQMATLGVAARSSGTSIDVLREAALRAGQDTSLLGVSADSVAAAMEGLYKAGLDTTEIFGDLDGYMVGTAELSGALKASIDLAAASELSLEQASETVAIAMATFGLEAEDATAITDNFVQTADASVTSVGELAEALTNVGPTAAAFGWSLEEVNVALALLSERGIRGAEAGTSLKSMMTNLMRPTDDVRSILRQLNVTLYDNEGHMRSLPDILGQLEAGLAGVSEEQRNQAIQTLAGTYGMKALNTLLAEGADGWVEMEGAISEAATAQDVATAKADTWKGTLGGLVKTGKTFLIEVGTPLINDFLRPAAEWTTELIGAFLQLPDPITKAGVGLGVLLAVTGPLLRIGGGLIGVFGTLTHGAVRLVTGLIHLPTILGNIGAGLSLLRGGAGIFEVASLGATGLVAALIPLAPVIGLVVGAHLLWRKAQRDTAASLQELLDKMGEWEQRIKDAKAAGEDWTNVIEEMGEASRKEAEEYEKMFVLLKVVTDKYAEQNVIAAEAHRHILENADSYEEYNRAVEMFNAQLDDGRAKIREQIVAENELLGTTEALVDQGMSRLNEWQWNLVHSAAAWIEKMTEQNALQQLAKDGLQGLMDGFVRFANLLPGVEMAQVDLSAATDDVARSQREAMMATDGLTLAEARAILAIRQGRDARELAARATLTNTQRTDALRVATSLLAAAQQAGIITEKQRTLAEQELQIALGLASEAEINAANQVMLLAKAHAIGIINAVQYARAIRGVHDGTFELTEAEMAEIEASYDQVLASHQKVGAMGAVTNAAEEQKRALQELLRSQLDQAESLKDASPEQVAHAALSRLDELLRQGKISFGDYQAAVMQVQDRFELVTPQSRALARGIDILNAALAKGQVKTEDYDDILAQMIEAAEGGEEGVRALLEAFGISIEEVDPAAESVDAFGESAGRARDPVGRLTTDVDTFTDAAERATAHPWVVRIETEGGFPEVPTPPGGDEEEEEEPGKPKPVQTGMWRVPAVMTALLHPEELVVPMPQAEVVREWITAMGRPAMVEPATFAGLHGAEVVQEHHHYPVQIHIDRVGDGVDVEVMAYRVAQRIQARRR